MNQQLWQAVEGFDLDSPAGEYPFSVRLANENYWTKAFTDSAILEYKKFMYLAATSGMLVSPSGVVDSVWHQHLIFTQSYQQFCALLGKQVQHIPSTQNKDEFQKFKSAKEQTAKLYTEEFGPQPPEIWEAETMFDSLHLKKAKIKLRSFVIIGLLLIAGMMVPAYYLLKPLYVHIDNPGFLIGLGCLSAMIFSGLYIYNGSRLATIITEFNKNTFAFHLHALELIYLRMRKLSHVVNGVVNVLVDNGTIIVNKNKTVELSGNTKTFSREQQQVVAVLAEFGRMPYPILLKTVAQKPVFQNISNSMVAFQKYVNKSAKFGWLFYTNFITLGMLLICSYTRLVTGVMRNKPTDYIAFICLVLTVGMALFLIQLTTQLCRRTLPNLYEHEILPARVVKGDLQWNYFLSGQAAVTSSFVPLAGYVDRNSTGSGCGSSCGSSCGNSCGSSCGGCGGGD